MNKIKLSCLLYAASAGIFSMFFTYSSFALANRSNKKVEQQVPVGDSTQPRLQKIVDSVYGGIAAYNDLQFQADQMINRRKEISDKYRQVRDSLPGLEAFNPEDICGTPPNRKSEKEIKKQLRLIYSAIFSAEARIKEMEADSAQCRETSAELERKLERGRELYQKQLELIKQVVENTSGAGTLKAGDITYRYFIVSKNEYDISVNNNRNKGKGQSFNEVRAILKKEHKEPVMITNGGIFDPDFNPNGLLIENFKEVRKLDTTRPDNSPNGNFYMQPNGVFSIDSLGSFRVVKTNDFNGMYVSRQTRPRFATQSGPMLVYNGTINKNFRSGSMNLYIRSGVGEIRQDKTVFIISDSKVNFFDFALLFREVFGCKNALYLDGAISKMYLNEEMFGIGNPRENDGMFGPIISITRPQK